jgi:hypothetical protein
MLNKFTTGVTTRFVTICRGVQTISEQQKNTGLLLYFVALGCLYMIVAAHAPISVLSWQAFDDMLFMNNAQNLAEGRWLGGFSELTLVKGPGYPLFLALNYWLGLPVSLGHALFYCLSLVALSYLALRITKSFMLAAALFGIVLWDPRVFELGRVMRDAIYSGQAILVIVYFSKAMLLADQDKFRVRHAAIAGLLLGWFWLTREEGVWIIPGLFFLAIFSFVKNKSKEKIVGLFTNVIVALLLFFFCHAVFFFANHVYYGSYSGVDVKEKSFQSAMRAMDSVRLGNQIPFVSVPRAVRKQIYLVSPSFFELKKYIDPENGVSAWEAGGCQFRPTSCGDIGNGFFMWAVREAAGRAGHYSSPKEAARFFSIIASDINRACEKKILVCEKKLVPYMPPITHEQLKRIPSSFGAILDSATSAGTLYSSTPWKIFGDETTFSRALAILNYPAHYPYMGISSDVDLVGWYHEEKVGNAWFSVRASDDYNQSLPVDFVRNDSLDLVATFADKSATHQRFSIKTRCSDGCKITFIPAKGKEYTVDVRSSEKYMSNGEGILAFDYIKIGRVSPETQDARARFSFELRSLAHKFYRVFMPVLLVSGLVSFILSLCYAVARRQFPALFVVAGAFWISIIARSVILVMVDISSFPAIVVPYMQPIFAFSIIASILSFGLMWSIFFRGGGIFSD